jgi:hypothetical protein
MSELDDAIREHLELKRRHGARDAEVKQLEDEAFGTGERPADPFSAADQLLRGDQAGEHEIPEGVPPVAEQGTPTDVPPPETPPPASFDADAGDPGGLAPPSPEDSVAATDAPPAAGEVEPAAAEVLPEPDLEPESVSDSSPIPPPPSRPDRSSEVVSMPTEEHPAPGPPSEEFAAADPAAAEPGAQQFDEPPAPVEELTGAEAPPLDAPPADEPPSAEPQMEEPQGEAAADESFADEAGGPVLYDFEADSFADTAEPAPAESVPAAAPEPPEPAPEAPVEEELAEDADADATADAGDEDAFADLGPADSVPIPAEVDDFEEFAEPEGDPGPGAVTADTSEREALDATEQYPVPEQEPPPFEPASTTDPEPGSEAADEPIRAPADDEADEDLLEETPDFLEEKEGEDEDLWFERRPPKDFDFDD